MKLIYEGITQNKGRKKRELLGLLTLAFLLTLVHECVEGKKHSYPNLLLLPEMLTQLYKPLKTKPLNSLRSTPLKPPALLSHSGK